MEANNAKNLINIIKNLLSKNLNRILPKIKPAHIGIILRLVVVV